MAHRLIPLFMLAFCSIAAAQTKPATPLKVVYVVDLTGTMLSQELRVKDEVQKALNELADGQPFNVYVTLGVDKLLSLSPRLIPTTAKARQQGAGLVRNQKCVGGSGLIEKAMADACKLRPDVIWFVTDGNFESEKTPEITDKLLAIAKPAKVRLNTTLTLSTDYQLGRAALIKLAAETGGTCYNEKGEPATAADTNRPDVSLPDYKPGPGPSLFKLERPQAKDAQAGR